jgi:hypothetical protein
VVSVPVCGAGVEGSDGGVDAGACCGAGVDGSGVIDGCGVVVAGGELWLSGVVGGVCAKATKPQLEANAEPVSSTILLNRNDM